ncbi:peptide ABC transporter permease [Tistrella bauzanensis]|uniref:Peptide ABC transporter permease n=1 Tax=Tistrella bauzanensis TaxID=657419 RepID=A0ABQ1IFU5_9PROT|nr:ABC transporter permease [Tistrella bauzanensis]GGB37109.1 peptide ABC transporter permease [Tistrella bauzanensis]
MTVTTSEGSGAGDGTAPVPRLLRRRRPVGLWIGATLVGLVIVLAVMGLIWTPYNPMALDIPHRLQAPSAAHWLGTDAFGRDVLSRIMSGATTSVTIGVSTVVTASLIGAPIGILAGFLGGMVDRLVAVVVDALLAFPGILMALGLMAVIGPGESSIVLALGIAYTPAMARVVRSIVMSLRSRDFVEASMVTGNSTLYTMAAHVLPNAVSPIIVLATSMFGWALLAESALSFLGLGVPPPAATWGSMLSAGRPHLGQADWLTIFPGACITLALLGICLVGDALRDRLDPRMRKA